ncbi:hypothetical protein WB91_23140, partial [bacteria symbiont BFo1 of Frankliniella occidentalis]
MSPILFVTRLHKPALIFILVMPVLCVAADEPPPFLRFAPEWLDKHVSKSDHTRGGKAKEAKEAKE